MLIHPNYWQENGFQTLWAMHWSHDVIARAVEEAVAGRASPNVLDLGCGNGALLHALHHHIPGAIPWGLDHNPLVIESAAALWPKHAANFAIGSIRNTPWPFPPVDVAIIMPGRVIEQPGKVRTEILAELKAKAAKIVAYAYADWVREYGDLAGLCVAAGMEVVGVPEEGPGAQAVEARVSFVVGGGEM